MATRDRRKFRVQLPNTNWNTIRSIVDAKHTSGTYPDSATQLHVRPETGTLLIKTENDDATDYDTVAVGAYYEAHLKQESEKFNLNDQVKGTTNDWVVVEVFP